MNGFHSKVITRFPAIFLIFCFSLPNLAFALRQTGLEEQTDNQGKPVGPKGELISVLRVSPSLVAAPIPQATPSTGLEEFVNSRGEKIVTAITTPARTDLRPVAFVFHGLSGNKEQEHIRKLGEVLVRAGYIVIRPDFRNNRPAGGGSKSA